MAEQKLIISATTPDGLDASKTISNFNPEASNAQLAQLGKKLTAFTDNTYGRTDRVIKYNCDTESGDSKQTPTFTLDSSSISFAQFKSAGYSRVVVTYDGDGLIFVHASTDFIAATSTLRTGSPDLLIKGQDLPASISEDVIVTFRTTETETYKAAEATFTIAVKEG